MNMQNVKDLAITEGDVRTIHDSDGNLLWGRVAYDTKYAGDTFQQTYTGKNLFNIANPYSFTVGPELISLPAGTYHLTCGSVTKGGTDNPVVIIGGSAKQLTDNVDTTFTLTTDITDVYFYSNGYNYSASAGVTSTVENLMISTSGGAYEPYVGGTASPNPDYPQDIQVVTGTQTVTVSDSVNTHDYTVALGQLELAKIGTYQDYIYKSGNNWYVHKAIEKIVLDGSENWYFSADNSMRLNISPDAVRGSASNNPVMSDRYMVRFTTATDNSIFLSSAASQLGIVDWVNGTSKINYQTWLSTHNTTVYYALATPTDTQITDSTLIGQLEAVHEWLTRYGYNSVVSGTLPLIIEQTNLS